MKNVSDNWKAKYLVDFSLTNCAKGGQINIFFLLSPVCNNISVFIMRRDLHDVISNLKQALKSK